MLKTSALRTPPGLWAHLDDACDADDEQQLRLRRRKTGRKRMECHRVLRGLKASGSTKKFPLSFASRRSFTSSEAVSAYSWNLLPIPILGIQLQRVLFYHYIRTFKTSDM